MYKMTRVYVLTKSELTPPQRGVQGAHALAELVYEYGQSDEIRQWVKEDKTLVFLQANEQKANDIVEKALSNGVKASFFFDDYYPEDFGWTAVAFYPITKENGKNFFKGLRLA